MTVAGGTAFLVQRQRVLAQVDTRLEDTASRLRSIAADKEYPSIRELLTAAIQQITPDTNEGILGIIDGKAAVVPGSQVGVSLEKETAFIARINRETGPGAVVLGTDVSSHGALRYLAVPVRASGDSATGVYVAAYSIDAELLPDLPSGGGGCAGGGRSRRMVRGRSTSETAAHPARHGATHHRVRPGRTHPGGRRGRRL
jgi:two-component system OmpR family sensor kinase